MNRRNFRITALASVLVLVLGAVAIGTQAKTQVQPAAPNDNCSNSSGTGFLTLFLFETSLGVPAPGVRVTAGGISQVTNSSGLAVVGGGNFTNFNVSYNGDVFWESLAGHYFPLVCTGSSYYRVVSMSFSTTTVPAGSEDQ